MITIQITHQHIYNNNDTLIIHKYSTVLGDGVKVAKLPHTLIRWFLEMIINKRILTLKRSARGVMG